MPKRVLIVATNGFEQSELTGPRDALRNAGIETVVASPESGQMNPDILRMNTTAVDLVRTFVEAGKPVAAICHGPWLLVEAGVAKGRTLTGWPSIRTDLRNAGAEVVDKEVVVDGNVITSRKPDDIPAFSNAMIAAVKEMAEAA